MEIQASFSIQDEYDIFLAKLKALPINYEYAKESDGSFTGWTEELQALANAPEINSLKIALVSCLKDNAKDFSGDYENWKHGREWQIPYLIKILNSTQEELLLCLHGRNYEDI